MTLKGSIQNQQAVPEQPSKVTKALIQKLRITFILVHKIHNTRCNLRLYLNVYTLFGFLPVEDRLHVKVRTQCVLVNGRAHFLPFTADDHIRVRCCKDSLGVSQTSV